MSVSANGIDGKGPMIEGNPSTGRTVDVIPSWGVNTLTRQSLTSQSNDIDGILDIMSYINEETDTGKDIGSEVALGTVFCAFAFPIINSSDVLFASSIGNIR